MNAHFVARLRRIIDEFAVVSTDGFRLARRDFSTKDPRWTRFPRQYAGTELAHAVACALYLFEYCRSPLDGDSIADLPPDPEFLATLSAANPTADAWEPDWQIDGIASDGRLQARKTGRVRTVRPGDCRHDSAAAGGSPRSGDLVSIAVRRHDLTRPGVYLAYGRTLPDQAEDQDNLRIYFHCDPPEAVRVLRSVATALNAYEVPFRLKCLDHPRRFDRTDSVVLYVERRHAQLTLLLIDQLRLQQAWRLQPSTPLFTRELAPGLALAEDPGNGESFGQHRCRQLAEALLEVPRTNESAARPDWQSVVRQFQARGVDLAHPHLTSGSDEWLVPPLAPRVVTSSLAPPGDGSSSPCPSRFTSAAAALGRRIVRETIWSSVGCGWLGAESPARDPQVARILAGYPYDLGHGAAGIAVFLARAATRLETPLFFDVASGAADRLARAVDGDERFPDDGEWHQGAAGVVGALYELGIRLCRRPLIDAALRGAGRQVSRWIDGRQIVDLLTLARLLELACHANAPRLMNDLDTCLAIALADVLPRIRGAAHAIDRPGRLASALLALAAMPALPDRANGRQPACLEAGMTLLERRAERWTGAIWPELSHEMSHDPPADSRWRIDVLEHARALCRAGHGATCCDAIADMFAALGRRPRLPSSQFAASTSRPRRPTHLPSFLDPLLADLLADVAAATGDRRIRGIQEEVADHYLRSAQAQGQPWDLASCLDLPPLALVDGLAGVAHFLMRIERPRSPGLFELSVDSG